MTTEPSSTDPTPDETSPRPGRRRLWASIAAAELVLLLLVAGAAAAFLDAAHTVQSERLADYHAAARAELAHREELEQAYGERQERLDDLVELEGRIDDLHASLKKSDCWKKDPCFGAVRWNRDIDRFGSLFDEHAEGLEAAAEPVGEAQDVTAPVDLWLLDWLDDNDAAETTADLDAYLPRLEALRREINGTIADIEAWENDCEEDEVVSCEIDLGRVILEREL